MKRITTQEEIDQLLQEPEALLLKHSTRCPISSLAHREIEKFLRQNPDRIVHKVHVIEDRPVSDYVVQKTGIAHASPQFILLRGGNVHWHGSHNRITARRVAQEAGSDSA